LAADKVTANSRTSAYQAAIAMMGINTAIKDTLIDRHRKAHLARTAQRGLHGFHACFDVRVMFSSHTMGVIDDEAGGDRYRPSTTSVHVYAQVHTPSAKNGYRYCNTGDERAAARLKNKKTPP